MQRWVIKKSICDGGVGDLKAAAQRFSSTTKLYGANEAQRSLRPNERLVMRICLAHYLLLYSD